MEDSIQKQVDESLEEFQRHHGRPSQYKHELVSLKLLIPRLVVPTSSLSIVDHFSVTPSHRKLKLVNLRVFILTIDPAFVAQISRPLILIPSSSPVDTVTTISQNSILSKLPVSASYIISS